MRKKHYFIFLFSMLMSYGCEEQVSGEIIGVDPMAEILFEFALAEGFAESFILKDTFLLKDSVYQSEINKVLQFHKISPSDFSKSYVYYTQHPLLFKQVLDSANVRAIKYKDEAVKMRNRQFQNR